MKRVSTYTISILLVFVYLLSAFGFDVHSCSKTGSIDIILPFEMPECSHHDIESDIHNKECSGIHHDNNCCHNETHSISETINDHRPVIALSLKLLVSEIDYLLPSQIAYYEVSESHGGILSFYSDPPSIQNGYNKRLNVWLL